MDGWHVMMVVVVVASIQEQTGVVGRGGVDEDGDDVLQVLLDA